MREGARLQGIRSLRARLHFQPASWLFSRLNHEGRFGISSPIRAGLLEKERIRKKGVFVHDTAASSRSVLSYKFTSQTLTGAGVSCVCSWAPVPLDNRRCCNAGGRAGCERLRDTKELVQSSSAEKLPPGSDSFSNPGS